MLGELSGSELPLGALGTEAECSLGDVLSPVCSPPYPTERDAGCLHCFFLSPFVLPIFLTLQVLQQVLGTQ